MSTTLGSFTNSTTASVIRYFPTTEKSARIKSQFGNGTATNLVTLNEFIGADTANTVEGNKAEPTISFTDATSFFATVDGVDHILANGTAGSALTAAYNRTTGIATVTGATVLTTSIVQVRYRMFRVVTEDVTENNFVYPPR